MKYLFKCDVPCKNINRKSFKSSSDALQIVIKNFNFEITDN